MTIAPSQNHKGKGMWFSLFSWMSESTAERMAEVANIAFVVSLLVGVAATITLIGTTSVKEWYWEQDRRQSKERIADANASGEAAKAEAAQATERAEAERTARFKMLDELKPRQLTKEKYDTLVEALKGIDVPVTIVTIPDPEASYFGATILRAFKDAGVPGSWVSASSNFIEAPGVASAGVTIWEHPNKGAGQKLMDAFVEVGVFAGWATPGETRPGLPELMVFVGLKQPPFTTPPPDLMPDVPTPDWAK